MLKVVSKGMLSAIAAKPPLIHGTRIRAEHYVEVKDSDEARLKFTTPAVDRLWRLRLENNLRYGMGTEPLLYRDIYQVTSDVDLTHLVKIGDKEIQIMDFRACITYDLAKVKSGEWTEFDTMEVEMARAMNALKNHLHFFPFLTARYPNPIQIDAPYNNRTAMRVALYTAMERLTLKHQDDSEGAFALLCAEENLYNFAYLIEDSIAPITPIQSLICYDGWSGTRGNRTATYTGVDPRLIYLIDLHHLPLSFDNAIEQSIIDSPWITDTTFLKLLIGIDTDALAISELIRLS